MMLRLCLSRNLRMLVEVTRNKSLGLGRIGGRDLS